MAKESSQMRTQALITIDVLATRLKNSGRTKPMQVTRAMAAIVRKSHSGPSAMRFSELVELNITKRLRAMKAKA